MSETRKVLRLIRAQTTSDGAGVVLKRSIGTQALPELDPFLMLDNFGTHDPDDYIAGFPDHPHRGFETVTYMIKGLMRHRDNTGAEGLLKPGGAQWMTAGRGIVHSEMPEQREGEMSGFQLWVNLPASRKMCAPRYQDIDPGDIPTVETANGAKVRVVAGTFDDTQGPVDGIDIDPSFFDVALPDRAGFRHGLPKGHAAFVYVFEGRIDVAGQAVGVDTLAVLDDGDDVAVTAAGPARFILVAGRPIGEPIVRYGPFVMNTKDEIVQAIDDFRSGKF